MTLEQRIELASDYLCSLLKLNAPKDTWNLTINGIHRVNVDGIWTIVIGGETAPYAVKTNEPWDYGRNPNQNWVGDTIEQAKPLIMALMQGSYNEEEIANVMQASNYVKNQIARKQQFIANELRKKAQALGGK